MTLTDKINALEKPGPELVRLADVLKLVEDAVVVELDPKLHGTPPDDEGTRLSWAVLDTVYNLLGEYAVRVVLADIRTAMKAAGVEISPDEEIFRRAREADPGDPIGYAELAPRDPDAAARLAEAFGILKGRAKASAAEGIG